MGLFTNEKELKDKLEASTNELQELEGKLKSTEEEVKNLSESVTSFKDLSESLQNELKEASIKVTDLEATLKATKEDLEKSEANQVDFDAKVANVAQAKLANMGIPEPVASENQEEQTSANLYKEYRELQKKNPEAASKFWNENKSSILKG